MTRREYRGGAQTTTISSILTIGGTSITASSLATNTSWPTGSVGPFFVVIDRGKSNEEKILCSARSGSLFTVAAGGRGSDETSASEHSANATIEHVFTATDANEANLHVNSTTNVHGIADTSVLVVDADLGTAAYENIPIGVNASFGEVVMGSDTRLTDERIPTDGSVTLAKMAANSVDATKIVDNAVTLAKMADNSVGTTEIVDANVTLAKMAANSVGTSQIVNDSVTAAKIPDSTITSAKIVNGTIVNVDINSAAAIDQSKVSGLVTALEGKVASASGLANRILASGDKTITILSGASSATANLSYSAASFTAAPTVVVSPFASTLYVVGVISSSAGSSVIQVRTLNNTTVASNTDVELRWIATGT